ncbi:MAG: 6-phosphogluconolactonase [Myxococcota bacterium]|nr:6-phosphogluconolactonase [Myxococcota bacterium]MEC8422652.1 6-phosphogluconolactonase [Myxococcota bacterium]
MLPSPHSTRTFGDGAALATALAAAVRTSIESGLAAAGRATIAVSGGRTPAAFLRALFAQELPWQDVQVTLADDRCVPHGHERSNVRLLEAARSGLPGAAAPLIALTDPGSGAPLLDAAVPHRLDALVLGMGTDGHTASLFPDGDALDAALAPDAPRLVTMRAPGAPEPRITLSLPVLLSAKSVFLHIEGAAKHVALRAALGTGPVPAMPVRALLHQETRPITLFTAPPPGISP